MEQEYKWIIEEKKIKNILNSEFVSIYIINEGEIDMEATYYDDIYGTIKKMRGALRRRKQNEKISFLIIKDTIKHIIWIFLTT